VTFMAPSVCVLDAVTVYVDGAAVGVERGAGECAMVKSMPPLIEVRSATARGGSMICAETCASHKVGRLVLADVPPMLSAQPLVTRFGSRVALGPMDSATGLLDCFQKLVGWQVIKVNYRGVTFVISGAVWHR
jgi:hypothetical protein